MDFPEDEGYPRPGIDRRLERLDPEEELAYPPVETVEDRVVGFSRGFLQVDCRTEPTYSIGTLCLVQVSGSIRESLQRELGALEKFVRIGFM